MWDLSCVDWQDRIRSGQSLIPDLPLFDEEARIAVNFFDSLRLPDVPGMPLLKTACGEWYRQIVRAVFGSRDPVSNERHIREVFALVPKGQSKTSYSAGLMVTALLMNLRPRAEMLFVGPTQAISDLAFQQASGMIDADPELKKRFRVTEHDKTIFDLLTKAKMKVKTFDLKILTGPKPVVVLIDELHLLGKNPHASKVLRQIRGGLEKNPEGLLVIITTQSDDAPAGAFRDELLLARKIRDGKFKGRMLPVLYEFPDDIARDPEQWKDPTTWHMVLPNLGRSMWLDSLIQDWEAERTKGEHAIRVWASQHLNIQIGLGIKIDSWVGAEFWEASTDYSLTLDAIIERSEVIVVGVDGGGLDDLFGLAIVGRERGTRRWLVWAHAWANRIVLERRKSIASRLEGFADDGELTLVDKNADYLDEIIAFVAMVKNANLLGCVALDNEGPYGEFVDELAKIGVTQEGKQIVGVGQGYRLMNAIKTSESKLANGSMVHCPSGLMSWCVGNIKIEPTATAIRATKQNAGDDKIDPAMAMFDAIDQMTMNPVAFGASVYQERGIRVV